MIYSDLVRCSDIGNLEQPYPTEYQCIANTVYTQSDYFVASEHSYLQIIDEKSLKKASMISSSVRFKVSRL